jgi:hypothetical protein
MIDKNDEFKNVLEKIESSIQTKKEEKTALIESIREKQEEKQEKKEKKKKKKTKYEILKDNLIEMDKDDLIKTINKNLDKQNKSYLIDLAYELEVESI